MVALTLAGAPGRTLVSLLALFSVAALTYGVVLVTRSQSGLARVLEPYSLEAEAALAAPGAHAALAQTDLAQRATATTAKIARRIKLLPRVEKSLEDAAVPLRPAEALFFYAAGVVVLTLLTVALRRGVALPLATLVVTGVTPVVVLRLAISRRRRAFAMQLPEALRMLANSLRTGRSLLQGLQAVAREAEEPMASELGRVLVHVRLGRALDEALDEAAARMGNANATLVVAAVRMQARIGGNLAELLGNVADAIAARERLRGEVKALTAEGRISAIVLGVLPVGLAVVMTVVNPGYMAVLAHEPLGRAMVIGASGLAIAGFVWMNKVIDVEL